MCDPLDHIVSIHCMLRELEMVCERLDDGRHFTIPNMVFVEIQAILDSNQDFLDEYTKKQGKEESEEEREEEENDE